MHSFWGAILVIAAILFGLAVAPFFAFAAGTKAAV